MSDWEEIDAALAALEALATRKGTPNRYHVRELLVPLGERLVQGAEEGEPGEELVGRLERARGLTTSLGEAWLAAVSSELELACAEHVHSVDPRFLALSNYDWDYTLTARARLTARLAVARALGLPLPAALLVQVEAADRRLADHLQ